MSSKRMLMSKRAIEISFATLSLVVVYPFIDTVLWSILCAVLLFPLYCKLPIKSISVKALLTCIVYLVIIILPIATVSVVSLGKITHYVQNTTKLNSDFGKIQHDLSEIPYFGKKIINYTEPKKIQDYVNSLKIKQLIQSITSIFNFNLTIIHLIASLFISILLLYSFLIYGVRIRQKIISNLFDNLKCGDKLLELVTSSLRCSAGSLLISATIASFFMGIVYTALSLPIAFELTVGTFICALIPFLLIIYITIISSILFLLHYKIAAMVILPTGAIVNLLIDNLFQPKILSKSANIPFVISFCGIVFGISVIGPLGVFFGPTILFVTQNLLFKDLLTNNDKAA